MLKTSLYFLILLTLSLSAFSEEITFSKENLQADFTQFREILESNHCNLYEYTSKAELDSMFDRNYSQIESNMNPYEFFMLLAPITGKIGCMHTATWLPGRYFVTEPRKLFPLTIKLIENSVVVDSSYLSSLEIPRGSKILEINDKPTNEIIDDLKRISSADALNPYFLVAQVERRFSLHYASVYGLPDQFEVKFIAPGKDVAESKILTPASHDEVHRVVFSYFNHPPLGFEVLKDKDLAIITVSTFIYYSKLEYFKSFMDSAFAKIKEKEINNLILDVRGNGGGDPFCSSYLLSYLQKEPVIYFSEGYGNYQELAKPLPMPENNFEGNLYTLIDGSCSSTNGHFCALLKYNNIGTLVGTPSGATYKCNAGRDTEFRLSNTQLILTIGRSTYAAAVENMSTGPIVPEVMVEETIKDFIDKKDPFIEKIYELIER